MRASLTLLQCSFLVCFPAHLVATESWRELGQSGGHAVGSESLPTRWNEEENVSWKVAIPGDGWSSPVVDGGEIWLTTAVEEEKSLRVLSIDAKSGQVQLNVEVFRPDALVAKHARNSHATPTPILDGEHVYVHYGSYGTAALKRSDGEIQWVNKNTVIEHQWGPGSSPILVDDMIVFNCDGMDLRYVIALNKHTGEEVWRTPRSKEITKGGFYKKAFSTPTVAMIEGKPTILSSGANQFTALSPETGAELWSVEYFGYAGVTKPVIANGKAFVTSGYGDGTLLAVELSNKSGQDAAEKVVWSTNRNAPIIPTPIVIGEQLYMASDGGVLTCLDASTGKVHWSERVPGNIASSLTYGDGKLYVSNDRGQTIVYSPSTAEAKKLAVNQLDGNIQATPALVDGVIYLRTEHALYRIENGK